MLIEPITRANSREMVQRYQETYGFLKTVSGKRILVEIDAIREGYTVCSDAKGNKYQLNSDTGLELEFTQVPSQWFSVAPKKIVYVSRKADRQWKRGICHANTSIMAPRKSGESLFGVNVTPGAIEQLFYPSEDDNSFTSCYDMNCGLWSKHFAWAENCVYVRDLLIGTVDHKDKTIKLDDKELFSQEMRDALVRSNSDYRVVNA